MKLQVNLCDFRLFKTRQLFIIKVVLPSFIFLTVVKTLFNLQGVPFRSLVVDPHEFSSMPPYIGMISMLGILFWCASAAICIFVACILPKDNELKSRKWSQFLFFSGCITMFILLDDLFQIHEYYYRPFIDLNYVENPKLIGNLFEALFFMIYLLLISTHFYRFKMLLKKTNYTSLNLSFLLFAISIIIDIATPDTMPFHFTLEEGSKFLGIVIWFSYFLDCCYQQIQKFIYDKNYVM